MNSLFGYSSNPFYIFDYPILCKQDSITKCANYADDSRLPNVHEASLLFYNMDLVGNFQSAHYWSGSVISSTNAWKQDFYHGSRTGDPRSSNRHVRCIKK